MRLILGFGLGVAATLFVLNEMGYFEKRGITDTATDIALLPNIPSVQ